MRPVWQDEPPGPPTHWCTEAALASLLEVGLADVPGRVAEEYDYAVVDRWIATEWPDWRMAWWPGEGAPPGYSIAQGHPAGAPPRPWSHVVVCLDGVVVHDPGRRESPGPGLASVEFYAHLVRVPEDDSYDDGWLQLRDQWMEDGSW